MVSFRVLSLLLLVACGASAGPTRPPPAPPSGGRPPAAVYCPEAGYPDIWTRDCRIDADCFVAWQIVDGCGGVRGVAMAQSERAREADAAARVLRRCPPVLECYSEPRLADGTVVDDVSRVYGACVAGTCSATMR